MTNTYYYDNSINIDSVQELIDKLDSYNGKIDLFFETTGGTIDVMYYLIHYLNNRKQDITIYLIGEICSAGTLLLTEFKGKLVLHKNLEYILFHKWDRRIYTLRKTNSVDSSKLISFTDEDNKNFVKKMKKLGLTKEQIKIYNEGKNVVIYRDDFHKLKLKKK